MRERLWKRVVRKVPRERKRVLCIRKSHVVIYSYQNKKYNTKFIIKECGSVSFSQNKLPKSPKSGQNFKSRLSSICLLKITGTSKILKSWSKYKTRLYTKKKHSRNIKAKISKLIGPWFLNTMRIFLVLNRILLLEKRWWFCRQI